MYFLDYQNSTHSKSPNVICGWYLRKWPNYLQKIWLGFDCCQAVPHGLEAALVYCGLYYLRLFLRPFSGPDCYDVDGAHHVDLAAVAAVAVVGVVVVVGGVPYREADGELVDRLDVGHGLDLNAVDGAGNVEIVAVFSTPQIQNWKKKECLRL